MPPPHPREPWDRAEAAASDLRALLQHTVDDRLQAPSSDDLAAALIDLHRLKRDVGRTLAIADPADMYAAIDAAAGTIADRILQLRLQKRPGDRLKDTLADITPYRAQRIVRAHLERRKRAAIEAVIRERRVTWNARLTAADSVGPGIDERVVEFPLAFETARFDAPGRVLDAGAALNHGFVRALIDPPVAELVHFTQSGEREEARFAASQVSYVFGDLRSLPFRDAYFDRIVCVSTLEHVGMNNTRYGAPGEREPATSRAAVQELMRVLRPGGALLITVPYGVPADRRWFRVFGPADIRDVLEAADATEADVRYYRFDGSWLSGGGDTDWQGGDPAAQDDAVRAIAAVRVIR